MLFGVVDHSHEVEPGKDFIGIDFIFYEFPDNISLMNEIGDGLFKFLSKIFLQISYNFGGKRFQETYDIVLYF